VSNDKLIKVAAVGGAGYLLFRGLQLRQTAKDLLVSVVGIKFDFDRVNKQAIIKPIVQIVNPVGGRLKVANLYGNLVDSKGYQYGTFQTGTFVLSRPQQNIEVPIRIDNVSTVLALTDAIQNNRYPKLTMNYTIGLTGGILPIRNKVTFDTSSLQSVINWVR
jgi:hypothetical protein